MPAITSLFRCVTTLPPNQSRGIDVYYATQHLCTASFNYALYSRQQQSLRYGKKGGLPFHALVPFGQAERQRRQLGATQ
jgi:hypothetical protein